MEDLEHKNNLYKQHQLVEEAKHSLTSSPIHPKKLVPLPVVINDSDTTVQSEANREVASKIER